MDDLRVASDLREAADYLRAKGWMQGDYGDSQGRRCLVGAINKSFSLFELWAGKCPVAQAPIADRAWAAHRAVVLALGRELSPWNDEPGRTAQEVIDLLESTALALEVRALAEKNAAPREELVSREPQAAFEVVATQ